MKTVSGKVVGHSLAKSPIFALFSPVSASTVTLREKVQLTLMGSPLFYDKPEMLSAAACWSTAGCQIWRKLGKERL